MRRRILMLIPLAVFGAGSALAQNPGVSADRRPLEHRGDSSDPHISYGREGREFQLDRGEYRDDPVGREQAWRQEARRGRHCANQRLPVYGRGAGSYRNFHPGSRLPDEYRLRHYVVNEWRDHGLSAPPRGYHWVQVGNDFAQVAIASGVVMQLRLQD